MNTGKRFVVYYDGGYSSLVALKAAINSTDGKTEIIAVTFVPAREAWEGKAVDVQSCAAAVLAAAKVNARINGVAIKTEVISGPDPHRALVAFALQRGAEQVFIGEDWDYGCVQVERPVRYLLEDVQ